jgi:prephenate dehydrogenase
MINKQAQTVLVVGYGRFGQLLARILKSDFNVLVTNRSNKQQLVQGQGLKWVEPAQGIRLAQTIFYCVPIKAFGLVLKSHQPFYRQVETSKTLIDVLSVKVHAQQVFKQFLPSNCQAILTHPMFGPDSVSQHGLQGLPMVMNQFKSNDETYLFWKNYFANKGLKIQEMTPAEHDKAAAYSQGVAHFIGRVLGDFGLQPSAIDTLGAKKLQEIMNQTCNDSWQLFTDLQTRNPYTKEMRVKLGQSLDRVYQKLLPKRVNSQAWVFGIQGGKGSFNHQALDYYLQKNEINHYQVKYLHTTERVLAELHRGNIDYGQFAIHNSVVGVVQESVQAMANYKFKIESEFQIKIEHCLMKRKDVALDQITQIMTHPQVIKQCQQNIEQRLSDYELISGEGELIDHAKVAEQLSRGEIDQTIAVMGPKKLAEIYDLEVVMSGLQDSKNNLTSFMMVSN